jgi:hypothetical protein
VKHACRQARSSSRGKGIREIIPKTRCETKVEEKLAEVLGYRGYVKAGRGLVLRASKKRPLHSINAVCEAGEVG